MSLNYDLYFRGVKSGFRLSISVARDSLNINMQWSDLSIISRLLNISSVMSLFIYYYVTFLYLRVQRQILCYRVLSLLLCLFFNLCVDPGNKTRGTSWYRHYQQHGGFRKSGKCDSILKFEGKVYRVSSTTMFSTMSTRFYFPSSSKFLWNQGRNLNYLY